MSNAISSLVGATANGKTLSYLVDATTRTIWPETTFYVTTVFDALNRPAAIKELITPVASGQSNEKC